MQAPLKKNYPRQFNLGPKGTLWRVRWVAEDDDRPWRGMCDPNDCVIYIERGRPRLETFRTFIHEVIHAFAFELNIPKLHHHGWIKKIENNMPEFLQSIGILPF